MKKGGQKVHKGAEKMEKKEEKKFQPISATTAAFPSFSKLLATVSLTALPIALKKLHHEFIAELPSDVLKRYVKQSGLKNAQVIAQSGVTKDYFYGIQTGKRKPSREKTIQLCFGLQLNAEQSADFLKKMGHNELYLRDERDLIIAKHLESGLSLAETDDFLEEHGYDTLLKG
ncbi:hypothetical protein A6K76_01100 [Caryophanon latum]|uniref:Uncharacterized protein n=2 Tax=Caryophanon latum TaxID=33977 RepID=A0A1C0YX32_9BACL|nr:hypothetical protein A6K76_01100 [Caryophanon latum]